MRKHQVKFGIEIPIHEGGSSPFYEKVGWDMIKKTALESEQLGYDNLWMPNHFIIGVEGAIFEIWTTLSALSSVTSKIGLGTLVLCNSYRNPAVLAKMAATLDVISGGRLILGVGCGWYEPEYTAYGMPFPKPIVRINQMKEGIRIIKKMWTGDKPSYEGEYYSIKEAICEPKPVQRPYPPIIIGAERPLMLRAVAELADGWNSGDDPTIEVYEQKLEILENWCSEIGRDFKEITKSLDMHVIIAPNEEDVKQKVRELRQSLQQLQQSKKYLGPLISEETLKNSIRGTPYECVERIQQFVDLGVTQFMLWFLDYPSMDGMQLFAEKVVSQF